MGSQLNGVDPSLGRVASSHEPGVMPPLEPDLEVRALLLDAPGELDRGRERVGERLLAQDVEARVERDIDRGAVELRRRGDDDGVGHLDGPFEGHRVAARSPGNLLGA